MNTFKRIIALVLSIMLIVSVSVISAYAAQTDSAETSADTGITVHFESKTKVPYIYYWNALPNDLSTSYPGVKMTKEANMTGGYWYTYKFPSASKINMLFTDGSNTLAGQISSETTRNAGEYWYKDSKWTKYNPYEHTYEREDLREDSIYFVITTRFYDGDTGNNVHCWDDKQANNPDSDPAWRGDFKGLADKLDYIKALGFSAIWITPVVTNASGYDYHGYHAMDFQSVDVRYESSNYTYEDLISDAHAKGIKVIQDVVINHSGNFGESFLAPMFTKKYNSIKDLETVDCMEIIPGSDLEKTFPNYDSLEPGYQYQARLNIMKDTKVLSSSAHDTKNFYHHYKDLSWESPTVQTGQIAGDCVDINTENPVVAKYLNDAYEKYINMGIDGFRLDTEKHVSRLTLNQYYFPSWLSEGGDNFFIFGEVCTRVSEFWNHNIPAISAPFYTWAETDSKYKNALGDNWEANVNLTLQHYASNESTSNQPTSNNVYLNGITYHTPDYSESNGTGVIDFPMHWNFGDAGNAFQRALEEDPYYNDSTWNVTYVDSHDYGPNTDNRYAEGTQAWAENLNLMFTFRGIPCLYYGSEVEFQKGVRMDVGPNAPLSSTGRAYFGDSLQGNVTATDFSEYTASGTVAETLNYPLAKHIQKLNAIRRAVPALQKGQYTKDVNYVSGNMAFIRRYTGEGVDSLACVAITDGATFKNLPNGKYIDAVSGDVMNVTNGTLTASVGGKGDMAVYVCCASGFQGISGKIGPDGQSYLK